ncbi:hypothetical protein MTO96_013188 [Rhipicephalus appendiculatus]
MLGRLGRRPATVGWHHGRCKTPTAQRKFSPLRHFAEGRTIVFGRTASRDRCAAATTMNQANIVNHCVGAISGNGDLSGATTIGSLPPRVPRGADTPTGAAAGTSRRARGSVFRTSCIHTNINWLVIKLLVKRYRIDLGVPAFDGGKNLYTRRELKFRERNLAVDLEEEQRVQKYVVKIQYSKDGRERMTIGRSMGSSGHQVPRDQR